MPHVPSQRLAGSVALVVLGLAAPVAAQDLPLSEPEEGSRPWREGACQVQQDPLTGETMSEWCSLSSPSYFAASAEAGTGRLAATLTVFCDPIQDASYLAVWTPYVREELMEPTRYVVNGETKSVVGDRSSYPFTLFDFGSPYWKGAAWAGQTFVFEARGRGHFGGTTTAVWRLPFGASEQERVRDFLRSPKCRKTGERRSRP